MRAVLLIPVLVSACICDGYSGDGNKVYQRGGTEMLILCENGGFVANLQSSTLEGRYMESSPGAGFGVNGTDGQLAFDLMKQADGTATTPQLGDTPWTEMQLDMVALDHANVQCTD